MQSLDRSMQATHSSIYTGAVIVIPHTVSSTVAIDWYAFLERQRLPSPTAESLKQFRDASVLVTGAGGSIGSALSLQLATLRLRQLVLLDASEQAIYRLQSMLADAALPVKPHVVLANIADAAHLSEVFGTYRPELIFHAAAYKHVPLLEEHPLEAIANNALGTLALAECATKHNVARVVLVSTDKAVTPISILGASKRIAERIILAHEGVVLRLANVLGSEGSVSEIFLRQIATGGPLTITDPDAERYFLTCEEAVDLLLASASAKARSMLVPNLDRQYKISSLAEFLIRTRPSEARPPIVFTGLRPGDKTREALWSTEEGPMPTAKHGHFEMERQASGDPLLRRELIQLKDAVRERDLPRALEIVLQLVPSYTPSATVRTLQRRALGALQS
jgi:FlaA1/EpsC-like NDP-sugar epimerase